ncbi:hypothetical protein BGX27_011393 [Mortierella sp. AM989]|nr:hypothetical protein BGX27_011393 [Mortierella sp. AM989]
MQTALGFIAVIADDSEVVFDDELIPNSIVETVASICYFYLESIIRFAVAMALLDTWQYFLHRLFHNVPYLYKHFHSRHHRLIVTYPFGALYNHPFEGFMMDSVGASLAFLASGMGNRGALVFFSFSTLKTLDDHCGYNLPISPLQLIFSNNADYHDIHHQPFGFKKNFSQPFGIFWDRILGTHMSREEANEIIRKKEERKAERTISFKHSETEVLSNSVYRKDYAVYSSGNNSGNDSQEEDRDHKKLPADRPDFENFAGVRERLLARARLDSGFVSGKGQGKAL